MRQNSSILDPARRFTSIADRRLGPGARAFIDRLDPESKQRERSCPRKSKLWYLNVRQSGYEGVAPRVSITTILCSLAFLRKVAKTEVDRAEGEGACFLQTNGRRVRIRAAGPRRAPKDPRAQKGVRPSFLEGRRFKSCPRHQCDVAGHPGRPDPQGPGFLVFGLPMGW